MPELSSAMVALPVALAFGAGFVSSMAGAGGLIILPALLWAGLPPLLALGTNKVHSALGTLPSTLNFLRSGHLCWAEVRRGLCFAGLGAMLGALAVQRLSTAVLEAVLPVLLIAIAGYFLLSPRSGERDLPERVAPRVFDLGAAPAMGFYGGFFAPGTGAILPFLLASLRGCNLRKTTAHTKALAINGNSALLFAVSGRVLWSLALAMAGAQILGAWLGSGLVQPVIVAVTLAVVIHLLWRQ